MTPAPPVVHVAGPISAFFLSKGDPVTTISAMKPKEPKIKVEYGTDVTIATFEEATILQEQQIRELEAALLALVQKNEDKKLVLNFERVQFMSSAFLGLLVKVHKRVIEAGGHLQIYNLDPKIHKIFEITRLTKVFDIVPADTGGA